MENKIKSPGALLKAVSALKRRRKKIVFTNGCFDILHVGHVAYLKRARALGDALVIGLNSDDSVRAIKGESRPLNRQDDRAEVLSALSCVDYVTVFSDSTPERLIKSIQPDVLVKGSDWKADEIVGGQFVRSYGGRVVRIPFVKGYSTTSVIDKLRR